MRIRQDFINELTQQIKNRPEHWEISTPFDPNQSMEIQSIREQSQSGNHNYQASEEGGSHRVAMLDLANALHQDIADCVEPNYQSLLKNTSLLMMPLGNVDAFCTQTDLKRQPLDGSIIILNEGLFYGLHLLFKALVIESLDNDLLQFRSSGKTDFHNSINFFLERDSSLLQHMHIRVGDPDTEKQINKYQSAAATLILQFIALHEFGHIALDHFGQLNKSAEFINLFSSAKNTSDTKHHQLEFEADAFALKSLMRRSHSEQSMWANFYSICLFYIWLNCIEEKRNKPLSNLHPRPMERISALRKLMENHVGNAESYKPLFEKLEIITNNWQSD